MATVSEIYTYLDAKLPTSLSCDWDNDGLMICADAAREVSTVLFALDITPAVIEYAAQSGTELILSHHPLIFRGIRRMDGSDTTSRKVAALLRRGISAMSFHTRLDMADGGINDILAAHLSLSDTERFGPAGEEAGRIGILETPLTLAEFCTLVKETLKAPHVCAADSGSPIRRVAVLGGAGKDYIDSAARAGADVLLTGEVGYNAMLEAAENGLSVVTAGHYHTEALFSEYFTKALGDAFPELHFVSFPAGCALHHF